MDIKDKELGYTAKDIRGFVSVINENKLALSEIEEYTNPEMILIRK
jgi:hypothetical protein